MTTPPVIELPGCLLPVDIVDVTSQHPGIEILMLKDRLLERSISSVTDRQNGTVTSGRVLTLSKRNELERTTSQPKQTNEQYRQLLASVFVTAAGADTIRQKTLCSA